MKLIEGLERLKTTRRGSAVAIGNFDGIHLGHNKILRTLAEISRKTKTLSLVLTFSPHPERVLGGKKICMIQTLDQRLRSLRDFGIHTVLIVPFDHSFSTLSEDDFVREIILKSLRAKYVVVGKNFRFGKNRRGNIHYLRAAGRRYGFSVHAVPPVKKRGVIVSSSMIRELLKRGKIEAANELLGRAYGVDGTVIRGEARGKILGYPTANILTENEITPSGIFISSIALGASLLPSLTNIGHRPTFGPGERIIETYILNFNKNLYGKKITICFHKKLRKEKKFRDMEALTLQIRKDLREASRFFGQST